MEKSQAKQQQQQHQPKPRKHHAKAPVKPSTTTKAKEVKPAETKLKSILILPIPKNKIKPPMKPKLTKDNYLIPISEQRALVDKQLANRKCDKKEKEYQKTFKALQRLTR